MNAATGPGAGMKDQTLQRERTGPEEGEIQALGGACRMVYQKDGNRNRRDIQDLETGRLCDARKWISSRTDAGSSPGEWRVVRPAPNETLAFCPDWKGS